MKKRIITVFLACTVLLAVALPTMAAGIDGTVELVSENRVNWIDRLDLSHADAAPLLAFYNALAEGADNDGEADFLIEDHPEGYSFEVVKLTGTFSADAATVNERVGSIGAEIIARYKPFVMAVYDAFDRDHPEVFWLSGERLVGYGMSYAQQTATTYSYTVAVKFTVQHNGDGQNPAFDVRSAVYPNAAAIKQAIGEREAKISAILAGNSSNSPYALVKYFNSVLTARNEYNTIVAGSAAGTPPVDSWESISALLGRTGTNGPVCEGYARAFKVLCDRAGVPCVLVDGNARSSQSGAGEAHMWNYVQIGDEWYAVDVTWNDPVGGGFGAVSGMECETWLLHGSETVTAGMPFLTSHAVSNKASLEGVAFTNGPVLSEQACADPTALPETVLNDVFVTETLTYGDTLTLMVTASAGGVNATNQTVALYVGQTKLAESNTAVNGTYTLTYDTTQRKLYTGNAQVLTLRFSGDATMTAAVATVTVSLQKAPSIVVFATDSHSVDYTGGVAALPAVTVTLLGADTAYMNSLSYTYRPQNGGDEVQGIPMEAGSYAVTVRFAGDDWYLAGTDELALTITPVGSNTEQPSEDAEDSTDGVDLPSSFLDGMTTSFGDSGVLGIMIACAATGVLCILLAVIFGRKKAEKKEKRRDDGED